MLPAAERAIQGGTVISDCQAGTIGGAVYAEIGAEFTVTGASLIVNCTAPRGGGLALSSCYITITDGSCIKDCHAEAAGDQAAVVQGDGELDVENGTEEGRRPKLVPAPITPTWKERAEHEKCHIPYRS